MGLGHRDTLFDPGNCYIMRSNDSKGLTSRCLPIKSNSSKSILPFLSLSASSTSSRRWLTREVSIYSADLSDLQDAGAISITHRRAVTDSIHLAEWRTLYAEMCVNLDGFLVDLIGEKIRDSLRQRVHSYSRRPQHKVSRDLVLSDRPVRRPQGIHNTVVMHRVDASQSDKVYLITPKFVLRDGQHELQKNQGKNKRASAYLEMASEYCEHETTILRPSTTQTYCVQNVLA